ncbi:MAG: DUF4296 domain-containing protein [Saprospiraceae bacterium]
MKQFPTPAILLFFGSLLFQVACHSDETLPIDPAKMADVLVEIHLVESALDEEVKEKRDSLAAAWYPFILKNYGLNRQQFDTCLAVMKRNPDLMGQVYEKVKEQMKKKKLEFED